MKPLALKGRGLLVEAYPWPISSDQDPPRALKALARIVDGGLCHRCGSCVGICPTDVLALDQDEYPVVKNMSSCTDCDLCVRVCPGDQFDVENVAKELFGFVPDYRDMHGHFRSASLSHATDWELRKDSTSGGLITALLLYMLEKGEIDGAIVVSSDDKEKWKGKPMVARSKEELLGSTKSKYAIAPTNSVLGEIRKCDGRYALVGLPCQIHGYQKAARLDRRLKERIVLTIGLFCHAAVEHDPLRHIWSSIEDKDNVVRFVSRVGKHPGTPHVEYHDGKTRPVYFPKARGYRPSSMEVINILYRLYTPPRCLTCYDSTSEFADIAVGDPWMAPPADDIDFYDGYSFTLARTERGETALQDAERSGAISLRMISAQEARTCNTMMGEEKRWRAFRVIETLRRQGKAIPQYGFETPKASGKQLFLTECNILSHIFCFLGRGRLSVLRLALSRFGYSLLWLNHQRRTLRNWKRDSLARFRRRFLK